MVDGACFCGCRYSFTGDVGACPQCGEYVTMTRASIEDEQQMGDELNVLLASPNAPTLTSRSPDSK